MPMTEPPSTPATTAAAEHFRRGVAAQERSDHPEAIAAYREVLALDPNHFAATCNLAMLYHDRGRHAEAERLYLEALRIAPQQALPYTGLGDLRFAAGRSDEALAFYQRALALEPGVPAYWHNLGVIERHRQQPERAFNAFRRAVELKADYPSALQNLTDLARGNRRLTELLEFIRRTAEQQPQAIALKTAEAEILLQEDSRAAGELLQRLYREHPDIPEVCNLSGLLHLRRGEAHQARHFFFQARKQAPTRPRYRGNLLYAMLADPDCRPAEYLAEARLWWRDLGAPLAAAAEPVHDNDLTNGRRLRLAFISGDLHRHSVSHFLLPLLDNLDRTRFEIHCFSDNRHDDDFTARIRQNCHGWHPIYGLDDEAAAARIREQRIDLLVELAGHTANNRLGVIARRPAPVQFSWLGYPGSTGSGNQTWRITDWSADPAAFTSHYTEPLLRLDTPFLCYTPPPEAAGLAIAKPDPGSGGIMFISGNNTIKLNRQVLEIWARILKQIPRSRLLLKCRNLGDPGLANHFRQAFAACGIAPERLELSGPDDSHADHFRTYNRAAITLDPFPYNGTTTTCDALWMGTPVITLRGDRHASRVGGVILEALGHPELIADNTEEYIAKAVALARDPARLSNLHHTLRQELNSSPLMNGAAFAAEFGRRLEEAWHQWRAPQLEIRRRQLERLT